MGGANNNEIGSMIKINNPLMMMQDKHIKKYIKQKRNSD